MALYFGDAYPMSHKVVSEAQAWYNRAVDDQRNNYQSILQFNRSLYAGSNTNKYDWKSMSKLPGLPNSLIRKYGHVLDWDLLTIHQSLSDDLMVDWVDYVNWKIASKTQHLTPNILTQCKDLLDWDLVSKYQTLGIDELITYKDEVVWLSVIKINKNIPIEVLEEYSNLPRIIINKYQSEDKLILYDHDPKFLQSNLI